MKVRFNSIGCIAVVMIVLAVPVRADLVIGSNDWDTGTHGWSSMDGWVVTNRETSGGNPSGWLSVTFTNIDGSPGPQWFDTVSTAATNLFAGTWSVSNWVEFDFWAADVEPAEVQVRFGNTNAAGSNRIWRSSVFDLDDDSMSTQSWTKYSASFFDWTDWRVMSPGYTEASYLADLDSIDWIGVYIFRNTDVEQVYGIDNFQLWIPEPVECIMVTAAMITSAMSLRKKRRRKRKPG